MSVMDSKFLNVYSYEDSVVTVPSLRNGGYSFPVGDEGEPSVIPIPPEEIKYINSVCKVFKNGILRFDANLADEIYEELGIRDTDSILFKENIDEILLNPDAESLKMIVNIKSSAQFERVRGRSCFLINNGHDISNKVIKTIDERYKEIRAGKLTSSIVVSPVKKESKNDDKIEELYARLAQYEKMLAKLVATADDSDTKVEIKQEDEVAEVEKPKRTTRKKSTDTKNG